MMNNISVLLLVLCIVLAANGFQMMKPTVITQRSITYKSNNMIARSSSGKSSLQMNFFGDAVKFFTNLNKEASAKHILMKGPDASKKLQILKNELESATDLSAAFSDLAAKVRIKTILVCSIGTNSLLRV